MPNLDRIDVLGGLLHRIGNYNPRRFSLSFDERLILQKTVYLMQEFGLFIGYNYSWYLRGPYSPSLSKDAYNLLNKYEQLPKVVFTDSINETKFNVFIDFINDHSHDGYWLEVIASTLFLYNNEDDNAYHKIYRKMKAKIPDLSKKYYRGVWNLLIQHELIRGNNNE